MDTPAYIYGNLISEESVLFESFKKYGRRAAFSKGIPIFRQGEAPNGLYLLKNGGVEYSAVDKGGKKRILSLHFGTCLLGLSGINPGTAKTACRCILNSEFYILPFSFLPSANRIFLTSILEYATAESSRMHTQLRWASTKDSKETVKKILEEYSAVLDGIEDVSGYRLTQQTISELAAISRVQTANILIRSNLDAVISAE